MCRHASPPIRLLLALGLMITVVGCGSRTSLKSDGGLDGSVDLGPPELTLDCGRRAQAVPLGQPLERFAQAQDGAALVSRRWLVVDTPPVMDLAFTLEPSEANPATFVSDTLGDFVFRFEGTDGRGLRASCTVTAEVFVDLPRALCPEPSSPLGLITGAGQPLTLDALAVDARGVAGVSWPVLEGPGPAEVIPADAQVATFVANAAGVYRLRFDVVDIDGGTDACEVTVEVFAPPTLDCSADTESRVGRNVELRALPTSRLDLAVAAFALEARPAGSVTALVDGGRQPDGSYITMLRPDRVGVYEVSFTATDTLGQTARCTTRIDATPVAPTVTCPTIATRPLTTVELVGLATDDGRCVGSSWTLVSQPRGSAVRGPVPADALETSFTPDIAGSYVLELRVVDDDGLAASCTATVLAIATEGIRVEIFWESNADMDTHLLNPEGTGWFNRDDCYYANCIGGDRLNWGDPDRSDDDPSLDIDDTDGFGPENINIDEPAPGTYRVGVHAFSRSGEVTVNVYCGGREEPDQTFGPRNVMNNRFWRVADVSIGRGCTIREIDTIASRADAESRR